MTDRGRQLRIGYLTQDFPPEVGAGPARVTEMAARWQAAGAEVTVITGMPNRRMPGRPDGGIHPDYRGRLFMEEDWNGIRVLRSWLFASPKRGVAQTLANNASFLATGALHGIVRARRLDVLIASSPPFFVHPAGEAMRLVRRVPLVLEIRDLWPDYMVQMGVLKNAAAQRALFALERYLLKRARHVVVVTESFRERVAGKGVPRELIDVIPNGVDAERYYRDPDAPAPLPDLERKNGELIAGYLGNFGAGQELRTVLEAAARLRHSAPHVRFVLVGDGTEKARVVERWRELKLDNVSIHPPISKDQTRAFYNACDLNLVPLAPIPIFSETIPSKIFEVMACQRPVLASVAGEAARIVRESGAGTVTPPGDAEAMAAAIERLARVDPDEREAMGRRGRSYVCREFNRETLAERYLEILDQVAGRGTALATNTNQIREAAQPI
jgi:glycosyltransferase involved in cell wall biosynthesis